MAMRQRFGGTSSTDPRQSYRPVYEDFQPQFELKEEHEAHIIHLHLPGFVKEQVRITFVHSPGVIRVRGQRPLGNNKWSRFNQTIPIQENCDGSKIHGKFNNGILTITIPKQVITQRAPKPTQEAPPTPSKTAKATAPAAEPKPQKLQEDLIPLKAGFTPKGSQKSTSSEPKTQKDQQGISQTAAAAAYAAAAQDEKQRDKSRAQEVAAAAAALDAKQRDKRSAQEAAGAAQDEKQREKKSAQEAAGAAEPKAQQATFTSRDEKERDDKNSGHPLSPPKGIAETKPQKDKADEALPKVISAIQNEKQRDEKRVVPLTGPERGISEPNKSQKGQDEIPPKWINEKMVESAVQSVARKELGTKDSKSNDANGKTSVQQKNAEKVVESTLHKERETDQRSKEVTSAERAVQKILEKGKKKSKGSGSSVDQEKPKEEDSIAANVMAAARQHIENLRKMNDEEKQMLINMGAAVLVLLAIGASVSYSFWSSGKAKN